MEFSVGNFITLLAAILAFMSSVIGIFYNRKYMQEKWWERKSDAYTRIIEALSDMVDYYQQMSDNELGIMSLTEEKKQEINERWRQANREVVKATNMGEFIISSDASVLLQRFRYMPKKRSELKTVFEMIEQDYDDAQKCLSQLIRCAKQDIHVK